MTWLKKHKWNFAFYGYVMVGSWMAARTGWIIGAFDVTGTVVCVWLWFNAKAHSTKLVAAWALIFAGATSLPQVFSYVVEGNISGTVSSMVWVGFACWAIYELRASWMKHHRPDVIQVRLPPRPQHKMTEAELAVEADILLAWAKQTGEEIGRRTNPNYEADRAAQHKPDITDRLRADLVAALRKANEELEE